MPGQILTLDIVANDQATPKLEAVERAAGGMSDRLRELLAISKQFERNTQQTTRLVAAQVSAETSLIRARAAETSALVRQTSAQRRYNDELTKSQRAQQKQVELGNLSAASINQLTGGTLSLTSKLTSAGIALGGVNVLLDGFSLASNVATTSIRLQGEALVASVKTAAAFEQEIKRVAAITGAGVDGFEKLRAAAIAGGASTLFTAQQAGEALRFLAQAGLNVEQSTKALPGALQLAAAGNLDLAQAADIATNILTGYNFQVEQLGRVNDVLVTAANSSNTNVQELGVAFSYTAGVAAATKQEFEEIVAVLEASANAGIKSSKAGRAVANAISRIQKPTAAGRQVLRDLNIALTDVDGRTLSLVDTLKAFEARGASTAQILTFFGEVAGRSVVTLLNNGTGSIDRYAEANRRAEGAAARFQATLQDTAEAQGRIFLSTIESLSIAIGSRFLPRAGESARVLSELGAELVRDEAFLDAFSVVAERAVGALAALLRAGSAVTPMLILVGGAALEAARGVSALVNAYIGVEQLGAGLAAGDLDTARRGFSNLSIAVDQGSAALDGAGNAFEKYELIGDRLSSTLGRAADGLDQVNTRQDTLARLLPRVSALYTRFGEALAQEYERSKTPELEALASAFGSLRAQIVAIDNTAKASSSPIKALLGVDDVSETTQALRQVSRLEADIAEERNPQRRLELEYRLDLLKIAQDTQDDEVRFQKERKAFFEFERKQEELGKKSAKAANKERKSGVATKLEEARLALALVSAEDQRIQIQIRYEQTLLRINASSEAAAVKAAQSEIAAAERRRALVDLERERAIELRQLVAAQEQERDQLNGVSALLVAQRREREALAELAATPGLDAEVRAEREKLISLQAQREQRDAIRALRDREIARETSFEALTLASLEARGDADSKIAALRIQSAQRLRQLALEETDAITLQNKRRLEELTTEREIAKLRAEESLKRSEGIRAGVTAGAGTDTSGLAAQFAAEQERSLALQIDALEVAKQQAELRGQDATFLDRRINQLRAEADAERAVVEAQLQRIEGTAQLAAGVTDLGTRLADFAKLGFEAAGGYDAMGAAISASAGLGAALAQGLGLSAKAAAKVQVAFNAAAAIAAFAGYAASGFTAQNLLTASIQHGVAAAKFGLVAGVGGGGGAGRGGGGAAGGSGGQLALPTYNLAAERDKTADAFARALREQLERPVQNVINIDQRGMTTLERAPAVARAIDEEISGARRSVYQSGRREG